MVRVAEVKYPRIERVIPTNEREVLDAAGGALAAMVRRRAQASVGYFGPLPRSRAGNAGWRRSGRLSASIGHVMRQNKAGQWRATVRPIGDLSDRDAEAIRLRAREKTKGMRAAAALGAALQVTAGGRGGAAAAAPLLRKKKNKAGDTLSLGRLVAKPVDTYAALAAVLSVPAKTRPRRALYFVVMATRGEEAAAAAMVRRDLKTELVTVEAGSLKVTQ